MTATAKGHRAKALRARSPKSKTSRKNAAPTKLSRAKSPRAKSSRDKVRAYRQRMRAKGLRLLQIWLPDTSTPEFRAQAHRASLAIANSRTEAEDQAFVDAIQWWTSDEAEALSKREPKRWWKEPSN